MQTQSSVLENLVQKRTGGVFNIRGISFQVHYTIWRLLSEFQEDGGNTKKFQLEGAEDLDFYELRSEHIQIKCLNKSLGANDFSENFLPNLVEVFEQAPESRVEVFGTDVTHGYNGFADTRLPCRSCWRGRTTTARKNRAADNSLNTHHIARNIK